MSTTLNAWSEISRSHRLMRRSSAVMKVAWSLQSAMLFTWYVCAFAYFFLHRAARMTSVLVTCKNVQKSTAVPWQYSFLSATCREQHIHA